MARAHPEAETTASVDGISDPTMIAQLMGTIVLEHLDRSTVTSEPHVPTDSIPTVATIVALVPASTETIAALDRVVMTVDHVRSIAMTEVPALADSTETIAALDRVATIAVLDRSIATTVALAPVSTETIAALDRVVTIAVLDRLIATTVDHVPASTETIADLALAATIADHVRSNVTIVDHVPASTETIAALDRVVTIAVHVRSTEMTVALAPASTETIAAPDRAAMIADRVRSIAMTVALALALTETIADLAQRETTEVLARSMATNTVPVLVETAVVRGRSIETHAAPVLSIGITGVSDRHADRMTDEKSLRLPSSMAHWSFRTSRKVRRRMRTLDRGFVRELKEGKEIDREAGIPNRSMRQENENHVCSRPMPTKSSAKASDCTFASLTPASVPDEQPRS